MFVFSIINGFQKSAFYSDTLSNPDNFLSNYLLILERPYYIPALVLLIPITGIFLNNKIGWILIQSYFFFLIGNLIFPIIQDFPPFSNLIISLVVLFVLILLIVLMNKKSIRIDTYNIKKLSSNNLNLISILIGITLVIFVALIKN
ncbi:MAG: hypothetical protein CMC35_07705 [Flavobacteriaceae bacterium]|nr:hypothetical protein [Flavobacteriaceae bacterium]